jgi:hypothetical protein
MAVIRSWEGALTDSSIRVRAQIAGASGRLGVSLSPLLTSPVYTDTVTADAFGWVDFTATGLSSDTQYWWAIEDAGVLDTTTTGTFITAPAEGAVASYKFACSSCANGNNTPGAGTGTSNDATFDTIRNQNPLFFSHLGDLHYKNITTADLSLYRDGIDDVLASSRQHLLYRSVPIAYVWDDHDYANNNSDRTDVGRSTAAQVFRERVPSYTLPDSANIGCYQSAVIGRVLHIWSDTRSYRDPSTDAASPSKTMLGTVQKAWMEGILSTSTAEAFVWHNPTPWMGLADDTWAGYTHERDELVAMFDQYDWLDRMICLNGDYHGLAMDSGGGNDWGGFPVAIFGSIDSVDDGNLGSPTNQYDQGPTSPGSHRYGTVQVTDLGDTLDLTLTAFIANDVLFTTSIHIVITPPVDPEEPPPPVPGVEQSNAQFRTHVTWLSCDLVSGRVITELPELRGSVSRILGAYTSSALSLPIPFAGPGALGPRALQATEIGRTMLVAVVNDVPTWAGIILTRQGGVGGTLQLGCVSLEGYLDRRYVGTHEWVQQDEVGIIGAGLAADAVAEGIGLVIDAPATGVKRDRSYVSSDDATVYSRLRELMSVEGGPEFTIDVDWADDAIQDTVVKTLRIRSRIGVASTQPDAVFQNARGASETTYEYLEDFTDGKGANHIVATSSGEGEDRPLSAPATDVRPGWPRYERRFSPSTAISDLAVLSAHANAELTMIGQGTNTFKLQSRWNAIPRLNLDWRLGDDVAWDLKGHRHPDGIVGTGRVIGWELDMGAGIVSPVLWQPGNGEV